MYARFAIARPKTKQELQAITAKARHDKEKSAVRIAAIRALANVVALTGLTQSARKEEKIFLGEISLIFLSVSGRYLGLPKAKIAKICKNCFKPENLYKFCYLKGRKNRDRNENIIFKYGQIKIKKVTGTFCNFENTINIWPDRFLNYDMVMMYFFRVVFPSFFQSLLIFHFKVRHLSQIYDWQHAVFPLAIDYYTKITIGTYTNIEG